MVRLIGAIVIGVAGCAVLVALGLWQVQRLEWKGRILSDIAARIEAAPAQRQSGGRRRGQIPKIHARPIRAADFKNQRLFQHQRAVAGEGGGGFGHDFGG